MTQVRMKINIKQKRADGGIYSFVKSIEKTFDKERLTRDLQQIKKNVLQAAKVYIKANRRRAAEKHQESWRVQQTNDLMAGLRASTKITLKNNKFQLSIGNKTYLRSTVPYWYVLNYGRKFTGGAYIPKPGGKSLWGYFGRGEGPLVNVSNQAFYYSLKSNYNNKKVFKITPKKPVTPLYYLNEMARVMTLEVERVKQEYKQSQELLKRQKDRNIFVRTLSEKDIVKLQLQGIDYNRASIRIMERFLGRRI